MSGSPRRRYVCNRCGGQFGGPDTELEPGNVYVCEPCYQDLVAAGKVPADD